MYGESVGRYVHPPWYVLPCTHSRTERKTDAHLAVNLVNSTTPYTYDIRTQTFLQPEASYQILHRAKEVNGKVFKELQMQSALVADGGKSVPAGTTLYDLINLPREEVARAPLVLDTLMKELEAQTA